MHHRWTSLACGAAVAGFVALAGCPGGGGGGGGTGAGNGNSNGNGGTSNSNVNASTAITSGRVIYQGQRCINCHGADGTGNAQAGGPTIVGSTAENLDSQVRQPCDDPNAITNCHPSKIPDLSNEQLANLAAYLLDLQGSLAQDPGPVCTDTPGEICTIAGNGVSGSRSGDEILARDQFLFWPQNVTFDPQGRVIITDWNNYLFRRIETTGGRAITDRMGNRGMDFPITRIVATGALGDSCTTPETPIAAINAKMNHTVGALYDDFIEDGSHNMIVWGWHQWKIKYIPVNADGTYGEMYCLWGNARGTGVEDIPAGWGITTDVNGSMEQTRFNLPSCCVYDDQRNFYIADQGNLRIRIIRPDADDVFTTALAFVESHLNNVITTWAGGLRDASGNLRRTLPDYSDSGDGGPVSTCTFNVQSGFDAVPQMRLALDRPRNRLYVADSENNRVRVIDLNTNIITTYAGGGTDLEANNVSATQAKLFRPADVDLVPDGSGDLLITDSFNHCVRLVSFRTTLIHTVAGVCGPESNAYSGDGGPATQARFYEPGGAYISADRTIFIADTINHRVRRVNPSP